MKITRILSLFAVISVASGCGDARVSARSGPGTAGGDSTSPFLKIVLEILEKNLQSGSVEYRGVCTPSGGIVESFRVAAPQQQSPPLQSLREAFAPDVALKATREESGLVRVLGGNVRADLLNLKITRAAFQQEREPWDAMSKLLALPEVKAYTQTRKLVFIGTPIGLVPPPSGRVLNQTITNVTLSQALDRIAETFPGVWIYGECEGTDGTRVYMMFHEFSAQPPSH